MSAPSLCSALAIADSRAFLMMPAAFFCVNVRMFSALSTGLPRTRSATRRPFCADNRAPRIDAVVSIVDSLLLHRGSGFAVRSVPLENARHREFAQLVPHHLLGDIHRHVLLTVVHGDREADEIREDRRAPRPGTDRLLVLVGLRRVDLLLQMGVDERSFFQRTRHGRSYFLCRRWTIIALVRLFLRVR